MSVKTFFALSAAKLTRSILRLMGRGATALPGKAAMKFCPDILQTLSRQVKTIIVTGTNGKTTSCRMIEQLLLEADVPYFANRGGANLIQGITTEFAMQATLGGKMHAKYAVIECDEAATKLVCRYVDPAVIVVTNVFSDQLDRFGDVHTTLESIKNGIKNAPHATLCLNADCSLSVSIAREVENPVIFYGVNTEIYKSRVPETSDAPNCLYCKTDYSYDYTTYGHLGGFHCPKCGYSRPAPDVAVTEIQNQGADSMEVALDIRGTHIDSAKINVPGGYNIYNAAGTVAAGLALGFDTDAALRAIANFRCGFGRMEKIDMLGHTARMILVKNPAGCNQTINFLANIDEETLFVICLNDNIGDGVDISWIWDVHFETLEAMDDKLTGVICAGTRRDEMALRLKYAGIPEKKIRVCKDYDLLINQMTEQDAPVVIMPTYSAMMELRGKLSTRFGLNAFWK